MLKKIATAFIILLLLLLFSGKGICQQLGKDTNGNVYNVKDNVSVGVTFLLSSAGRPYDVKIVDTKPAEIAKSVDQKTLVAEVTNAVTHLPKKEISKAEYDFSTKRYKGSVIITQEAIGLK